MDRVELLRLLKDCLKIKIDHNTDNGLVTVSLEYYGETITQDSFYIPAET